MSSSGLRTLKEQKVSDYDNSDPTDSWEIQPCQFKQDDSLPQILKCVCSRSRVSIVEPKNIEEAMADSAWIEAMQDELHQFDRLRV
ncbi:hypothetical protein Tco_0265583 [Tanacetum coccineum]